MLSTLSAPYPTIAWGTDRAANYFAIALRYWFYAVAILTAAATAFFTVAAVLST